MHESEKYLLWKLKFIKLDNKQILILMHLLNINGDPNKEIIKNIAEVQTKQGSHASNRLA